MGNFFGSNHWAGQRYDVTQVFVAADQAARIALGNNVPGPTESNVGDICVQTDLNNQWWIMTAKSVPSVNGDWTLITPENAALITVNPAILGQATVQAVLTAIAANWTPPRATSVRFYGPIAITPTNPIAAHVTDAPAPVVCVGLLTTDIIIPTCPTLEAGLSILEAHCAIAGQVTVRILNGTALGVATGAQNWQFVAIGTV